MSFLFEIFPILDLYLRLSTVYYNVHTPYSSILHISIGLKLKADIYVTLT